MNKNGSQSAQSAHKDDAFEAWWSRNADAAHSTKVWARLGWDAHAERVKGVIEAVGRMREAWATAWATEDMALAVLAVIQAFDRLTEQDGK